MKIYSKNVCPKCMFLKDELKRQGIAYEEINVDRDEAARDLLIEKGLRSMPIVERDGQFMVFDEIMEELNA